MRTIAVAVLLGLSLVAGCGPEQGHLPGALDGSTAGPEDPVTITSDPGSAVHDVGQGPQRVRPRPGMADLRRVPWQKSRPAGDRSVRVTYWSGVEPCNVLDHVEVSYAKREIAITLYEGHDPEAGDVACIEIAVQKLVRVHLAEPLGGRRIVDGAL